MLWKLELGRDIGRKGLRKTEMFFKVWQKLSVIILKFKTVLLILDQSFRDSSLSWFRIKDMPLDSWLLWEYLQLLIIHYFAVPKGQTSVFLIYSLSPLELGKDPLLSLQNPGIGPISEDVRWITSDDRGMQNWVQRQRSRNSTGFCS